MTRKTTTTRGSRRATRSKAGSNGNPVSRETYDVLVVATMSAGKSSFINALVGRELLPSANEATTACLTSIEHRRSASVFRGACYTHDGVRLATQDHASVEQVRAWNADAQVGQICLYGKFSKGSPASAPKLVLHDTPGPNNSQDERHAEMMLDAVRTIPFKIVCYVLNAGQLGTWDDRRLLEQLHGLLARQPGRRIVFILNKVDLLDPERGEDIAGHVGKARAYLEGLGFTAPIIVPTMASTALVARKAMDAQALTRVERARLRQSLDELAAGAPSPIDAAALPDALRVRMVKDLNRINKSTRAASAGTQAGAVAELEQLVIHSGIRSVEFLLNQRSLVA